MPRKFQRFSYKDQYYVMKKSINYIKINSNTSYINKTRFQVHISVNKVISCQTLGRHFGTPWDPQLW